MCVCEWDGGGGGAAETHKIIYAQTVLSNIDWQDRPKIKVLVKVLVQTKYLNNQHIEYK